MYIPFTSSADKNVVPLKRAHSHNDYLRPQPLFDALNNGFYSVEADIHIVNGDLLVAHDLDKCKPEKNLVNMYLNPVFKRVQKNNGHVYVSPSEFWLLIDIKSEPESTYTLLKEQLLPYKKYLTRIENGKKVDGAVTIVISGAVPREMIQKEKNRYVFIDGRLQDLEINPSNDLVPWISNNWSSIFSWKGKGEIPPQELNTLKEIVSKSHEQGRKVRFWGAHQTLECWEVLYNEGVDFLNTDFPKRLSEFLMNKRN
ncbi:MAG: phosphatidylinositol-specific phospholipase C/glycerophosphodiester phosphodiesterase family protein [Candidatus Hydrogenedens sp.]